MCVCISFRETLVYCVEYLKYYLIISLTQKRVHIPFLASSQLPVTQSPEDPMPSCLCEHLYTYGILTWAGIHTHTPPLENNRKGLNIQLSPVKSTYDNL